MSFVRWFVGRIVLLINWLTWPKSAKRSAESQQQIEQQLAAYSLYQFEACPFCVKVRRAMQRLNLPIELRDAKKNAQQRQELLEQGGRIKVPCLRIEDANGQVSWMYESDDIIAHLNERFPV